MMNNGATGSGLAASFSPAPGRAARENGSAQVASLDDPRLQAAMEEYLALLQQGQRPDRQAFVARYPELGGVLSGCLQGLDFVHAAGPELSHPAATGAAAVAGAAIEPAEALGDFRIVRELGRGGMGVVYEAVQISLGRQVALKVLPFAAALDAKQLQRFKNEAQAAAQLHHTNIVPVHYVGCERGVHFYAMQFIQGRDLASVLAQLRAQGGDQVADSRFAQTVDAADAEARARAVSPAAQTQALAGLSTERSKRSSEHFRTVARLGIQAAEALDHAHQMGVVHRDIKPANLLVDEGGRLLVTDFGLAQMRTDTGLTMTGDLIGTLRYMSPEQALAKRVVLDHRTDVYSLGATLYELLALQPVYSGADRQELLRQIAFEEPRRLRRLNRAVPAELEIIVAKALEKNPADRYATAQGLADDLHRFLLDKPIQAQRPSLVRRARKWMQRNRALVWSAAAAAIVTLAVLAGSIGYVVRDRTVRLTQVEQKVAEALAGARTAIEAGDLALAGRRVAEAQGHLGTEREHSPALATDIDRLQHELEARQADETRFRQFLRQTSEAQDNMSYSEGEDGGRQATAALKLYGVLEQPDWSSRLDDCYLTADQKKQVRETAYVTLVSLADFGVRWWNKGRPQTWQRSLELLQRAEAFHAPTRAFYFVRSQCHLQAGNTTAADEDFKRFKAATARTAWDYYLPGHTAGWGGDLEEAIRSYQAALRLQPNHYNSLFFLAERMSKDKINRLPEAIQLFTACIALRPEHMVAYNYRGTCHAKLGHLEDAEADFRKVIDLKPDYAAAHNNLGIALADQRKWPEAEAAFHKAIDLQPNFANAYSNLGIALADQRKWPEAEATYRKAVDLQPNFADAYSGLGKALADQRKFPEAEAAFRKVTDLKPDNAPAYYNLGLALGNQEKWPEAVAAFQKAIKLQPDMAKGYFRLGLALHRQGLYAAVVRFFEEAFTEKPALAEDLGWPCRYNAACAAALAGCGQGKDAANLEPAEYARLRGQALSWLKADLTAWQKMLTKEPDKQGAEVRQKMQQWRRDLDFAGVRGEAALAKLPEAERQEWQKLWEDVEDLQRRAAASK